MVGTMAERLAWSIEARARSQRLLLKLYTLNDQNEVDGSDPTEAGRFSILIGVAFSLWRAAFLAENSGRSWAEDVGHGQQLLEMLLATNALSFGTEHSLQQWTCGYYLNNAKLRLLDIHRRDTESSQSVSQDFGRIRQISLGEGTNPHESWELLCAEAERLIGEF